MIKWFFSLFIFLILPSVTWADSDIAISPVSLEITANEPIVTLNVKNNADNTTTIQADVMQWSQKNGQVVLYPTDDMVISPPLFQIGPWQTQIVRVAWLSPHPVNEQLMYRVLLREISKINFSLLPSHRSGLNFRLNISLPVFVQPDTQNPAYRWQMHWVDAHTLHLILANTGNVSLMVSELKLSRENQAVFSENTFEYVLPKQAYTWVLKVKHHDFNTVNAVVNGEWESSSAFVH